MVDDAVYLEVLHRIVLPLIKAFRPDVLVAQIGADSLVSDPLTDLMLTNNSYTEVVRGLKGLCGKILATGGGGYDIYDVSSKHARFCLFFVLECPACPVKYVGKKGRSHLKHLFNAVKKHGDGIKNFSPLFYPVKFPDGNPI